LRALARRCFDPYIAGGIDREMAFLPEPPRG
jgi:hypothetical protein